MFRTLPNFGSDPRNVAEVVRQMLNGKTNNTGIVELSANNGRTTTIYDERISSDSVISLTPVSMTAAASYVPYGSFQDLSSQTIASTTVAYPMVFDTVDFALGLTRVDNSKIKAEYSGLYNIQFSSQFANADSQLQDISIWFRKNGTNVPNSNGEFTVNNRHGSIDGGLIATFNIFLELAKDDYFEIMWRASNTAVTMKYIAAQTSPTRPATPSVICTVSYVSANSFTANLFAEAYVSSQTQGQAIITHPANSVAGLTYKYSIIG